MGRLVHTDLGSSSLVAHVLPYPPPPNANSFVLGPAVKNTHIHAVFDQHGPAQLLCAQQVWEGLLAAFPLKHKSMQTVLLAREIGRLMAWDGDSKNAVNTHFGKVSDIRRAFDYMGALTIDDVFRSVILATLKSSNNRAFRTAYDQILDDLDDDKDLTFAHIQTVYARQFWRTKERHLPLQHP
jgi:hypothetical protein